MGSAWLVVENFIKFLPGTPFQGTLPRKLVKMLGCPAWDIDGLESPVLAGPCLIPIFVLRFLVLSWVWLGPVG